MIKQIILSLILITMMLTGCTTAAQNDSQVSPADVVTETQPETEETATQEAPQAFPAEVLATIQAKMDDLTGGELPPGMVVWIDAPQYRFEEASGLANLTDETPMPTVLS